MYTRPQIQTNRLPQAGFTLVEVLVAISLLLITIVGPMTLISRSSQSTEVANQQVPAIFLAQEGAELVQKVRDDELLEWFTNNTHEPWQAMINELGSACFSNDGCGLVLEGNTVDVVSCSDISNCRLYYDASGDDRSRFVYDDNHAATPYTRVVYLNEVQSGREISVRSEVTWRSGSLISGQQVSVQTAIFNTYDTD